MSVKETANPQSLQDQLLFINNINTALIIFTSWMSGSAGMNASNGCARQEVHVQPQPKQI